MANLEKDLKQLIARVVRKETSALQAEIVSLRKALRALSKDYAEYCKLDGASWDSQYQFNDNIVDALSDAWHTLEVKGIVEPVAVIEEEAPAASNKDDKPLSLSADDILKIREKTGLNQSQFAALINVAPHSYHLWEHGKATPRKASIEKILAVKSMGKREIKRFLKEQKANKKAKVEAPEANA